MAIAHPAFKLVHEVRLSQNQLTNLWVEMRAIITVTLILRLSGIGDGLTLSADNKKPITAKDGGTMELVCTADRKVDFCEFITPRGEDMPFYHGASYPRMTALNNEQQCGIQVSNVTEQVFYTMASECFNVFK